MHSYGVDSNERRDVPFYLAVTASGVTLGLRSLLNLLGLQADVATVVPSGFVVYGLLHYLFDRHLWKFKALHLAGIVRVPVVDGAWEGELRSSASDYSKVHAVKLRIHQTWSTIRLTLDSESSFSSSTMAAINAISARQFELRWEYRAEAKEPAEGVQFNHRGVTKLRFEGQHGVVLNRMDGDYYTQHGRDTNGTILIRRTGT